MKKKKKKALLKKLRDAFRSGKHHPHPSEPDKYQEALKELDARLAALKKENLELQERVAEKIDLFNRLLEQRRKCE